MKKIKTKELMVHLSIIVLVNVFLNTPSLDLTLGVFNSGDGSLLLPSLIGTIYNIVLFYTVALYTIPVTFRKGGVFIFWLQLIGVFTLTGTAEVFTDIYIYQGNQEDYIFEIIIMTLVIHGFILILAFAYRFTKDWLITEQQRRNIGEWQARSELEILKSQINPHFLFNALNNLFSMSLQSGDEKTAEGISKLSEMMRYVMEKTGQEYVSLADELQYIQDYIHLQNLRFKNQVEVKFSTLNEDHTVQIAPMLLIPFVENAFKYGVSPRKKTKIEILVEVQNDLFHFRIENDVIHEKDKIESSGMGINNVKQRLNLIYSECHELLINEQNDLFVVDLKLAV